MAGGAGSLALPTDSRHSQRDLDIVRDECRLAGTASPAVRTPFRSPRGVVFCGQGGYV
jgi:hypothetical protein